MKKQVFGALVAGLLMVVPAASQDVPPGPLIPPIDVEKIQVKQSKKADEGWVLTISCSKSREIKLPEGTLLDCELRVGVTPVYYFKHQLEAPGHGLPRSQHTPKTLSMSWPVVTPASCK